MQLKLIEEPSSEIITLEETKGYLRIDHDFDDSLILSFIKSTREIIESIIQSSIMKQTWEYAFNNNSIYGFDSGEIDCPSIFCNTIKVPLPKPPIISIVSVKVDDDNVDLSKYSLEKTNNKFCLCINSNQIISMERISVRIVYNAGIADCIKNIPYQLKLANLMLVASTYQERFSYKQNCVISEGVKQLLQPFKSLRVL